MPGALRTQASGACTPTVQLKLVVSKATSLMKNKRYTKLPLKGACRLYSHIRDDFKRVCENSINSVSSKNETRLPKCQNSISAHENPKSSYLRTLLLLFPLFPLIQRLTLPEKLIANDKMYFPMLLL
ncbi:hypothetical protein NDU88_006128 [Pleurodeles waltl]|uniref:Uncharacterized protein n=1 Tax=Pleurodeles waltl TaxID=8319 RepID=A0AAV7NTA6_PLEWA|nr:hypothetical protein NDU88_006128 [Pleurodeles waltl]